jgi:2-iminobutanoate/2-iminopropanoate deaminase
MSKILCSAVLSAVLLASSGFAQKKAVSPTGAAKPATPPPFSPGILAGGTLYVSGQIGRDASGQVPDNFEQEVKNTLDAIGKILKAGGMTFDDVVAANVFLTDMTLFPRMNAVYMSYLKEPRPARTTVGVAKLADPKAHIEINTIAHK